MWGFFSKDPSKELVNFEMQEQIQLDIELQEKTIWTLNNSKKKGGASAQPGPQQSSETLYSVFSCQTKQGNEPWLAAAKNAFKRMKMLRHPNILMFQDGVENDKAVFIVTERVQPLLNYLRDSKDSESQRMNEISWGLYQIATALNFLNNDCKLVHNNVCMSSIVVSRAGEWKLTGFEYTHAIEDQQGPYKVLHSLDRYDPPEKSPIANLNKPANQSNRNSISTESGVDSWALGCLIWEIFNGLLPNMNALKNPAKIPKRLTSAYMELVNAQPSKRLTPSKFLGLCRQTGGFMQNDFVETLLFLEQIQIKDQNEKTKIFSELTQKLDDFPGQLCLFKILPQLLTAYEFGNAGSSVLAPLFKLGKLLDEAEYQKKIIPVVVKLFSSTDRTTRMRLLQQLNLFVEHLSATIINDQIFPHICLGFNDSNPAIRESTIRAMVLLAPKLNYNNMNVELMKHFARLQAQDDQGMIRTNTTVCIGKIATYINPQLRQRILLSAFPKSMRDPFPLARLSGIVALANTDRFYTLRDISTKVLPSLCMLCVDPEKDVRDEAFKTIKQFIQKLEKVSEQPELALDMEKDVQSCNLDLKNETSWTSWAMTSLSAKMTGYKNKSQQPSIALNTQPLGPPPALGTSSSSSENKAQDTVLSKPKDQTSSVKESAKIQVKQQEETTFSSGGAGWNLDDDEWKDLDEDGDQMEPLEPVKMSTNLSTKGTTNNSSNNSSKTKSDWSEWTNSFEDQQNDDQSDDGIFDSQANKAANLSKNFSPASSITNANKNKNSQSQLPLTSSYNWSSNQGNQSNQEDMFSSLVKDKPSSQATTDKLKKSPQSQNKSEWSNDWNDVFESSNKPQEVKKLERQQRNADKQQENENKQKQSSGPLKLGQKKNLDLF